MKRLRSDLLAAHVRAYPGLRLDSEATERELALRVIAAYPMPDEDDPTRAPTGNGVPICDRADAYVVAYALAVDRAAQREPAIAPGQIRHDATPRPSYEVRMLARTRYATDPNPIRSAARAIEHQAESGAMSRKIRERRIDSQSKPTGDAVAWRKPLPGRLR